MPDKKAIFSHAFSPLPSVSKAAQSRNEGIHFPTSYSSHPAPPQPFQHLSSFPNRNTFQKQTTLTYLWRETVLGTPTVRITQCSNT